MIGERLRAFGIDVHAAGRGDQITGSSVEPIHAIKPVTIASGNNDLAISLPVPKK